MGSETVFGHLALRFVVHPENLDTEALTFILRSYPTASRAFTAFVRDMGLDDPGTLQFSSQEGGLELSIPDMKCIDEKGRLRVIVENKFWAGLTENQPVTYIRELPVEVEALVLFIAPSQRLTFLWKEVVARCVDANMTVDQVADSVNKYVGKIGDGHRLAVTSWTALLDVLARASSGETRAQNDIAQLQGLCHRMDSEAFLPLRAEELTNLETARRFMNLSDLPVEIVEAASKSGLCIRKKESSSRYTSGTNLEICGFRAWLGFAVNLWVEHGVSPIWLVFSPYSGYGNPAELRRGLAGFISQTPRRCFEGKLDGYRVLSVPIFLLTGVEMPDVVADAIRQIKEVREALLGNLAVGTSTVTFEADAVLNALDVICDDDTSTHEAVLELSTEGGGITLFRKKGIDGAWTFWMVTDESSLEDHAEGIGPDNLVSSSEPSSSLIDALAKLDRYPWRSFTPKLIHPEFHELIRTTVQERGTAEEMSRWNKYETRRF